MATSASIPRQIIEAINRDDAATVDNLLRSHPKYRYLPSGTERWLGFAIDDNRVNVVKLLVSLGADPAAPANPTDSDPDPEGPLKYAAAAGHLEMVRYLTDIGVPVNHTVGGHARSIPLGMAAMSGNLEVVTLLVDRGAVVNPSGQRTPLDDAQIRGHEEVADYLRSVGGKTAAELTAGG